MTREQLTELYKFHKAGGKLLYGTGKYPVSVSYADGNISGGGLLQKVNFLDYRMFVMVISFLELYDISEIEQYLEVIKENGIRRIVK